MCMRTTRHRGKLKQYMSLYSVCMATMLEGSNNTISFLWEIKYIFMQNFFIAPAIQHMPAMKSFYSNTKPSLTCPVNRIAPFVTAVVHFDAFALAVAVTSNRCFPISSITNPTVAAAVAMDSGEWVPFGCAHSYTRDR